MIAWLKDLLRPIRRDDTMFDRMRSLRDMRTWETIRPGGMKRLLASLIVALPLLQMACVSWGTDDQTPNTKVFMADVARTAGEFATPCGVSWPFRRNESVFQCMADKLKAHQPFFGFIFAPGTDSTIAYAFALTSDDDLYRFRYDDYGCDPKSSQLCGVSSTLCLSAHINPNRWIVCETEPK